MKRSRVQVEKFSAIKLYGRKCWSIHPCHEGMSNDLHRHTHLSEAMSVLSRNSLVIKTDFGNWNPIKLLKSPVKLTPILSANSVPLNVSPNSSIISVTLDLLAPVHMFTKNTFYHVLLKYASLCSTCPLFIPFGTYQNAKVQPSIQTSQFYM